MSQLYARVFVQILDSSIAEDYMLRHVFEDFFKLVDHKTGIVDMTRQVLSRRLNIPIEVLNVEIKKLEAPDPNSRDGDFDGRRIERLDEHRDWGWKILNWEKYEAIRRKADIYLRVTKYREKEAEKSGAFQKPTLEEVKLHFSGNEMPMNEAERFFHFYESNGWKVGRNPMKSWPSACANWKKRMETTAPPSASVLAISQQASLARIEIRLKYISGQSPLPSGSKLIEERKQLLVEKEKCKQALGWIV